MSLYLRDSNESLRENAHGFLHGANSGNSGESHARRKSHVVEIDASREDGYTCY